MTRVAKDSKNIQVFRGGNPRPSVFEKHAGIGCCASNVTMIADKLPDVLHFDNGLNHLNPTGGNEKYDFPNGSVSGGFSDFNDIVAHINEYKVGAQVSVIAIPNYAFVTGVSVKVYAEESGLTFNLKTRNGLKLPADVVKVVTTQPDPNATCQLQRTLVDTNNMKFNGSGSGNASLTTGAVSVTVNTTQATADRSAFSGFGALDGKIYKDILGRSGNGEFALEADEIIVEVASMPTSGKVNGKFGFTVAVSYDMIDRAERV